MKQTKRIMILITVCVLLLISCAFAETHTGQALQAGTTSWTGDLYLTEDVTCGTVTVTGDTVLCLNGHTLTAQITVANGASLTIRDCVGGGKITAGAAKPVIELKGNARCTMNSGVIEQTLAANAVNVLDTATFEMHGGTIIQKAGSDTIHGVVVKGTDPKLIITGGKITCEEPTKSGSDGTTCISLQGSGGYCRITGGEFKSTRVAIAYGRRSDNNNKYTGTLIIEDGTFSGGTYGLIHFGIAGTTSDIHLKGGTFETTGGVKAPIISTTNTLAIMLDADGADSINYYTDADGTTPYTISSANPGKVTDRSKVYVLASVTVNIQDADGLINTSVPAIRGKAFTLPTELTGVSGSTYIPATYTVDETEYQPGDTFIVTAATDISVTLRQTYSVVIRNTDGVQIASAAILQGDAYTLPTTLNVNGYELTALSYQIGETTKDPGDVITVEGDMEITVDTQKHSCTSGNFDLPVTTSIFSPMTDGAYYLENDISSATAITVSGNVSLCLNGHTLTAQITVANGGSLTICDCKGTGVVTSGGTTITAGNGASVEIKGGKITTNAARSIVELSGDAEFTLSGGTIEQNKSANVINVAGTASLTISDGSVTQNAGTGSAHGVVMNGTSPKLTMTGGQIICSGEGSHKAVSLAGTTGSCEIFGGSITSGYTAISYESTFTGKLTISGGTFSGVKYCLVDYATASDIHLKGGMFTETATDSGPIIGINTPVSRFLDTTGAEVYDYYLDADSETKLSTDTRYTSETTKLNFVRTVYVSEEPIYFPVKILDADGKVDLQYSIRKGRTFTLPTELNGVSAGTTFIPNLYSINGEEYQPGDTLTITEETNITVTLKQTYTVSIIGANGTRITSVAVLQGESYVLPATLTINGYSVECVSYTCAGDTKQPGESIEINENIEITATVRTHTCSSIDFYIPIPESAIGTVLTDGAYYLEGNNSSGNTITVSGDVSLCLNGHTLSAQITVADGGSLTICDCQGTGVLTSGGTTITAGSNATVVIRSGKITTNAAKAVVQLSSDAECTISGGTIEQNSSATAVNVTGTASLTISGGSITQNAGTGSAHAVVMNGTAPSLTMSGGQINASGSGVKGISLSGTGGTCTISGGSVTSTSSAIVYESAFTGDLTISGGTITGSTSGGINTYGLLVSAADPHIYLKGGAFTGLNTAAGGGPIISTTKPVSTFLYDDTIYDYYLDDDSTEKLTTNSKYKPAETQKLTFVQTVYVSDAPVYYTVTITDADNKIESKYSARKGRAFTLPNELTGTDKQVYIPASYSDGENTYSPGDEIIITGDTALTATLKQTYTVTIMTAAGITLAREPVLQGDPYELPATLTINGYTVQCVSYACAGETKDPGDSIEVSENTQITVTLQTHTCSSIDFYIPIPENAIGTTLTDGAYYLEGDNGTGSKITVNGNVQLCLNGHTLTARIELGEGASFTLCDCSAGGTGRITDSVATSTAAITVGNGSTLDIRGGTIYSEKMNAISIPADRSAQVSLKNCELITAATDGKTALNVQGTITGTLTAENCVIKANKGPSVSIKSPNNRLQFKNSSLGLTDADNSRGGGILIDKAAKGTTLIMNDCNVVAGDNCALDAQGDEYTLKLSNTTLRNHYRATSDTDYSQKPVVNLTGGGGTCILKGGMIACEGNSQYAIRVNRASGETRLSQLEVSGTWLNDTATKQFDPNSVPGATLDAAYANVKLNEVRISTHESDAISFRADVTAVLTNCNVSASRKVNDRIRSALTTAGGTESVKIIGGSYDGNDSGYAISNRTDITIEGSPVIRGGRCGIYNKGDNCTLTITGTPTVIAKGLAEDAADISGEVSAANASAIYIASGSATISGGTYTGKSYGLYAPVGTCVLSGGVYSCAEDGVSPVRAHDNVSGLLDPLIPGLAYYTASTGDNIFESEVKQLDKSTSLNAWVRIACDHPDWDWTDSSPHTAKCHLCGLAFAHIVGEQASIDETLTITVVLQIDVPEAINGTWSMHYTRAHSANDTTPYDVTVSGTDMGDGYIGFVYHGINPQCMSTDITATLTFTPTDTTIAPKTLVFTDSVQKYCIRAFKSDSVSDPQKRLMADMLNYGTAMQNYRGWKKGVPANGGDAAAFVSEYASSPVKPDHTDLVRSENSCFTGCTVRWTYKTELGFCAKLPAGVESGYIIVNDGKTDHRQDLTPGNESRLYIDVAPQNYETVYTCKMYNGSGEQIDSMSYSVNSYIYAGWDYSASSSFRNLLRTMQAYGVSARALTK